MQQLSERIVVLYDNMTAYNNRRILVTLSNSNMASRALEELNQAPLFDKRIRLQQFRPKPAKPWRYPELRWGWHATSHSEWRYLKQRPPAFIRPTNIFAPMRESRRVIMDNLPSDTKLGQAVLEKTYDMFHSFNVLAINDVRRYQARDARETRCMRAIDFATKEEADMAVQLHDGAIMFGYKLRIAIAKPPMKHLAASWDTTKGGYHNSLRDTGSAVGTNYETVSIQ